MNVLNQKKKQLLTLRVHYDRKLLLLCAFQVLSVFKFVHHGAHLSFMFAELSTKPWICVLLFVSVLISLCTVPLVCFTCITLFVLVVNNAAFLRPLGLFVAEAG